MLEHGSAAVASTVSKAWLEEAAKRLPRSCQVVFLADRGCADTQLMGHLKRLGWHVRMRITSHFWVDRPGRAPWHVGRIG